MIDILFAVLFLVAVMLFFLGWWAKSSMDSNTYIIQYKDVEHVVKALKEHPQIEVENGMMSRVQIVLQPFGSTRGFGFSQANNRITIGFSPEFLFDENTVQHIRNSYSKRTSYEDALITQGKKPNLEIHVKASLELSGSLIQEMVIDLMGQKAEDALKIIILADIDGEFLENLSKYPTSLFRNNPDLFSTHTKKSD